MATDVNQTIKDSRKAAMSILDSAKDKDQQRGPQNTAPQVDKTAVRRTKVNPVDEFLKAAKRKEQGEAIDLAERIRSMSDEDFDKAVTSGELTPEQIRRGAYYDWDTYMDDVWSETDLPDQMPEPSFDEFMEDPERYGYKYGLNEDDDRIFERYRKTAKQQ